MLFVEIRSQSFIEECLIALYKGSKKRPVFSNSLQKGLWVTICFPFIYLIIEIRGDFLKS